MQAVPAPAPAPAEPKVGSVKPLFSAFDDCKQQLFVSSICPMPADRPPRFEDMSELEPQFDPKVHLALGEPEKVTLLDFTEATVTPPAEPNGQSMLAYTTAFRILSDEGVRVVRDILKRNEKYIETCERQPANLRGLAYTSKFIRDFNESPEVMAHLARFAGQPLVPHYMPKNYSHTNIGRMPPAGEVNTLPVDQWHCDSVPFVLIIILSDMTGMVGGELQSIKRKGREAGFQLIEETNNEVPASDLLNVNYERQGYGLFMQGSEIVHHVTPVQKALEPRLTVVNSYMPANCFARDRTVYHTFIKEPEALLEFARGRAWRAQNQLAALVQNAKFSDDASVIADHIKRVMSELQMTVDLIEQRASDRMDYFDEVAAAKKKGPQANRAQTSMM